MSKQKFHKIIEVCADCGTPEPSWASVNRGVYLCNDCAGIHRNLGRHVSQVKHLHRSQWHQNQLNMVNQLVSVGANSIWEHSLLDPAQMRSGKRKPNPNDSVHSTKSDFIRAKYEQLAFVHRPPRRDDDDLGKQLHSSVRTANLDTSLRLLSLGAQANFFHLERGNTPLHVAAKAGQALQVELLVTYGADPAGLDINRQTPENLARSEGHHDLADRIVELQYELSDRLSFFVWSLRPDHKLKNHYAIPKSRDNGVGMDGRKRLQALSNPIFEELAMDVYDEIDRRETEHIWQQLNHAGSKITSTAEHVAVPFLPVNSEYSTTRNQGRQKLARFTQQEFCVLISDILYDIMRRQSLSGGLGGVIDVTQNDDANTEDPIYDVPPEGGPDCQSIEHSADSARTIAAKASVPYHEFLALKQKLLARDEEVIKLTEENRDLSNKVTDLAKHNHELIKQKQQAQQYSSAFKPTDRSPASKTLSPRSGSTNSLTRPTSVFNQNESIGGSQSSITSAESREQRRRTIHGTQHGQVFPGSSQQEPSRVEQDGHKMKKPPRLHNGSPHNSVGSDYDNNVSSEQSSTRKASISSLEGVAEKPLQRSPGDSSNVNENNNIAAEKLSSSDSSPAHGAAAPRRRGSEEGGAQTLPKADEVIRKTETVTKNIQNLLQAAQKKQIEGYLKCSENILLAVREIVDLFPECPDDEDMSSVIIKLENGAEKLRNRCRDVAEQGLAVNSKQVTEEIIKNAYEIAKAEKELVTMTTKLHSEASTSPSH